MQTLHQYMMETKSVEYVIAVIFLAAFCLFWQILKRARGWFATGTERISTCHDLLCP